MKASEGRIGRTFIIRLEDGDTIPGCIEDFARDNHITVGHVTLIGGIGDGEVVVGPRKSEALPPEPMLLPLDGAHEVVGAGIIAPDERGEPVLHIHAALGRSGKTTTGCLRPGVTIWVVGEAIILEIVAPGIERVMSEETGFALLDIPEG